MNKEQSNWHKLPGNRHTRGYGYHWNKLRKVVLTREPLCRMCERIGKVTTANIVDHIKPKAHGGTDSLENLQPLCVGCNKAKTSREFSGAAVPGCDVDGMPADSSHHWNK